MSGTARFPFTVPIVVMFRDLDALGHVNNAVYFSYYEHARIGYGLRLLGTDSLGGVPFILAEATATYLKPAFYGDALEAGVRVADIGTKSFVMEYGLWRVRDGELLARGRTVQVWYDYAAGRSQPVPDTFRAAVERDNAVPG